MQIPLHPESYKLLAFEFEDQVYTITRFAFGTSVSSSIFNRCARTAIFGNKIFSPIIRAYVDDIKIETESFEDHPSKLIKKVKYLAKSGMSFSLEKLTICRSILNYLGFKIKNDIISKGTSFCA